MYRASTPTLTSALEAKLAPHGFKTVDPDPSLTTRGVRKLFHRKTWNTNRAVVLAEPGDVRFGELVERMRHEAGAFLGSSWWSQLGLQLVVVVEARLPTEQELGRYVDQVNTQGVLVQSVFAVDPTTAQFTQARTWGQMVTGKFQDAIAAALSASR
jgi:hypothetical protein